MTNTQGRWAKDEALMYNVNRLPEHVLDVHPHDKSEVVMLRRGIVGFYRQTLLAGPAEARKYADDCNRRAKVSPHVLEAMRHGALFGFGTINLDRGASSTSGRPASVRCRTGWHWNTSTSRSRARCRSASPRSCGCTRMTMTGILALASNS
jgi:hypothetical protein